MDTINVLIMSPLNEICLKQIAAVSPRLKITDASVLNLMKTTPPQEEKDEVSRQKLNELLAETEIYYGFRAPVDLIARASRLKWYQCMSAGVDHALTPEMLTSPVILTNTRGIHALQISELVFNLMLMQVKNSLRIFHNQRQKKWEHHLGPGLLAGKTLGIAGFGSIGKRVAYLGKAFGMRVVATRRSARRVSHARYADVIYPLDQLNQLLAESDFVVNALPSTNETFKLFGEKEFRNMKPTSFFINIGRGTTVDEEALIQALKEKRIAGAGLDTFIKEPLPAESPLWEMPEVIVTPHIAGFSADYPKKCTDIFCENLKRYLSGKRMINVVNKKRGY